MLKLLLQVTGWVLAHTPEPLLHGLATVLGEAAFWVLPGRRRVAMSNLDHAFPGQTPAWRRRIARLSSRRMVETGLFSLATPHMDERHLHVMIRPHASLVDFVQRHQRTPHPVVLVSPHIAYWEAQIGMPIVLPQPFPEMGVIYRPLDNPGANAWVTFWRITLPSIRPGIVAGALFGFVTSFGNLEMSLFLVGPGRTTLPIVILQYLEWKIDPTIAAVSVIQIVLIAGAMLVTDRYVKLARVV